MSIVKLNNRVVKDATAFGSITGLGNLVFISRSTASSSSSINITSGINSTYKEYIFVFNNIHPASDGVSFQFNGSIDGGSNYNATKTTTYFFSYQDEDANPAALAYVGSMDHAQATGDQILIENIGNDNDQSGTGYLHLFEPSSTTFAKHFISTTSDYASYNYAQNTFVGGYFNTTSAIDAITFKFSSGNIDSGTIDMYGVL